MNLRTGAYRESLRWVQGTALALAGTLACLAWSAGAGAGSLQVDVMKADGKPLAGAVVMVQGPPGAVPAKPVQAIVDQVERIFTPDLVVVPVGSKISFPNTDKVSHQVYSFSPTKRFQLPLYRGTPYPPVLFERPGIVTLGCNIHDDMIAYVVVTQAPWFGRTGVDGSWRAEGFPAGEYRVEIWHPLLREPGGRVERTVPLDGTTDGRLLVTLTKPLRPGPLGRKPRSWSEY